MASWATRIMLAFVLLYFLANMCEGYRFRRRYRRVYRYKNGTSTGSTNKGSNTGMIIGIVCGVVGGLILIGVILKVIYHYCLKSDNDSDTHSTNSDVSMSNINHGPSTTATSAANNMGADYAAGGFSYSSQPAVDPSYSSYTPNPPPPSASAYGAPYPSGPAIAPEYHNRAPPAGFM